MYEGFPIEQTNKGTWQHMKNSCLLCWLFQKKKKKKALYLEVRSQLFLRSWERTPVFNCQNFHCKIQPSDLCFKSPENDNILISERTVFYTAYISAFGALIGGKICDMFTCGNSDKDDEGSDYSYSVSLCSVFFCQLTYRLLLFPVPLLNLGYLPWTTWNLLASCHSMQPLPEPVHPPNSLHEPSQTIILNTWLFSKKEISPQNKEQIPWFRWWSHHPLVTGYLSNHGFHRHFCSLMNNASSISTLKLAVYAPDNAITIWAMYQNDLLSSTSCHWTHLSAPEEFILCTICLPIFVHLLLNHTGCLQKAYPALYITLYSLPQWHILGARYFW